MNSKIFVKNTHFESPTMKNYLQNNSFNLNKRYLIDSFKTEHIKFSSKFDVQIYQTAESLYNQVGVANALTRISFPLFNSLFPYIPKLILKIPLWKPYKKHFKILNRKNTYFILTNSIPNKKKNIFILPLFMYRYKSHYTPLLKKEKITKIPPKFCAFIVSNPSNIERLEFYQKLSKYKKIDSFGKIFKNADFKATNKVQHLSNHEIYKNYKFVICFENSYENEYVTEKLPNAMLGDAIPIYKGAPNVGKYFNTKSFINYDDYGSFDNMIKKIIELDRDDEKYLEFINKEWITPQNKKNIEQKEKDFEEFLDKVFKE